MNIVCKHCGSNDGFYIKAKLYGTYHEVFNSDGSTNAFDSNTSDSLIQTRGKNVYCIGCDRVICKVEEIEDELQT